MGFNSAYAFLEHYYSANTGQNRTGWENAEYQAILDKVLFEEDEAVQHEMYMEAEQILMDEMPFYSNLLLQQPTS